MLPVLEFGPWQVSTYQIIAVIVLTTCGTWAFNRLLRIERPPGLIMRGTFLAILSGFAGAFLITYFINTNRVARDGFLARPEGVSMIWGLIIGLGMVAAYCRWHRISLGRALDMAAPPVALGLAIGRLGCAAAGCCYGRPTSSWLGVYLPDDNGFWATRYPTQLMAFAANLVIFFILLAVERYGMRRGGEKHGWPFDGFLALLGLFLYSLKRFGLSFLRQSGIFPLIGPFSWMHVSALIGLTVTALLILWNLYRRRGRDHVMKLF
jgi:phosphatidylglycerol:prolipoprotein diacylglycerol transferase